MYQFVIFEKTKWKIKGENSKLLKVFPHYQITLSA